MDELLASQEMTPEERRGCVCQHGDLFGVVFGIAVSLGYQKVAKPKPQSTSVGMFQRENLPNYVPWSREPVPNGGVLRVTLGYEDASTVARLRSAAPTPNGGCRRCNEAIGRQILPSAKWVKLGSVEERAVAQICMKIWLS